MIRPPAWIAGLAATALFVAALDEPWDLAAPAPAIATKPPRLEDHSGQDCGTCHAAVAEEWAASAHAIAWLDEAYRDELEGKTRPESCHGCHVPQPLLAGKLSSRPDPRADRRHLGISCESCHLAADGALLGPTGVATGAHATRSSEHLTARGWDKLCSACHSTNIGPVIGVAKDFDSSRQAERGKSCLGCHAHEVERAPSRGAAEGAVARRVRSHALQTPRDPAFLRRAFDPALRVDGDRAVVLIRNRAGHRVPGLVGRTIVLEAQARDAAGNVLARKSIEIDTRRYLPVDGEVEIPLEKAGVEVRLVGRHHDPRAEDPVVFLETVLRPEGG